MTGDLIAIGAGVYDEDIMLTGAIAAEAIKVQAGKLVRGIEAFHAQIWVQHVIDQLICLLWAKIYRFELRQIMSGYHLTTDSLAKYVCLAILSGRKLAVMRTGINSQERIPE